MADSVDVRHVRWRTSLRELEVRVTATHVEILNPFRRVAIPIAHITGVTAGSNMRVETAYGRFYAWGVEAANAQIAADDYGTQDELATLIEGASAEILAYEGPPVRYRFSWPDPLFLLVGAAVVVDALVLAMTGPGA